MSKKEMVKRYVLCAVGLIFMGYGVAATKLGCLGVSPISSIPNVLNIRFPQLSLGSWLIIWNCIMIVGQIVILKRDFKLIQLMQIPLSFLFGFFTNVGVQTLGIINTDTYAVKIALVIIGTIVLGLGITMTVIADTVMNSGEAFVKAVSDTIHKEFGNVKICFDIFCVSASIVLSFIFFGRLEGTREGTIIAAVFTGFTVKMWTKLLKNKLTLMIK